MSSDTIPKTEVTVNLPSALTVGHATVSNSLRDVDSFRVTHTPERQVSAGITVPEYVSLYIGQGSTSLPPDVWLNIIDALNQVLAGVPSLNAVTNA
jgi:hypothetical protein